MTRKNTSQTLAASTRKGFVHESPRAQTIEWFTPPEVFQALGLHFDLDVCSPGAGKSCVPADRHYTIHDDGLTSPWYGTVWCNPPYGNATRIWLRKLAEHGDGIALVFNRTDTAWFQETAATADVICFTKGRIPFIDGRTNRPAGSPGTGSALIGYGPTAQQAIQQSGLGLCFQPAPLQ